MNEQTIASLVTKNTRLQLLKITSNKSTDLNRVKYELRINRKIIDKSISEYQMRKLFAVYAQNTILQLTIY